MFDRSHWRTFDWFAADSAFWLRLSQSQSGTRLSDGREVYMPVHLRAVGWQWCSRHADSSWEARELLRCKWRQKVDYKWDVGRLFHCCCPNGSAKISHLAHAQCPKLDMHETCATVIAIREGLVVGAHYPCCLLKKPCRESNAPRCSARGCGVPVPPT